MVSSVVLHLRYGVRSTSDHAEVSHNSRLSCTKRLPHTQGVRRDGEEPLDRLLPVFYRFPTGWFRNSQLDLLCVASWYDLPPCPRSELETQISEAAEFPNLPFYEYRICSFRPWATGEVIYIMLSLVYGTFFPLSAHTPQHLIRSSSKTPRPCLSSCIPRNVTMEVLPVLVVCRASSTRSSKTPPPISSFSLPATFYQFSARFLHL